MELVKFFVKTVIVIGVLAVVGEWLERKEAEEKKKEAE